MGDITKNFSFSEFEKSDKAVELGIDNTAPPEARSNIKKLVDNVLQPLCDRLGAKCVISSGYRCAELNAAVGGVETSQHRTGEAADCVFVWCKPIEVARAMLGLTFDQIVLYNDFTHISYTESRPNRQLICYNRGYTGGRV